MTIRTIGQWIDSWDNFPILCVANSWHDRPVGMDSGYPRKPQAWKNVWEKSGPDQCMFLDVKCVVTSTKPPKKRPKKHPLVTILHNFHEFVWGDCFLSTRGFIAIQLLNYLGFLINCFLPSLGIPSHNHKAGSKWTNWRSPTTFWNGPPSESVSRKSYGNTGYQQIHLMMPTGQWPQNRSFWHPENIPTLKLLVEWFKNLYETPKFAGNDYRLPESSARKSNWDPP